jgi:hypothetical protein
MAISTLLSGIFFLVFGSGNAQKWGLPSSQTPIPEINLDKEDGKLNKEEEENEENMEKLIEQRTHTHLGSVVLI